MHFFTTKIKIVSVFIMSLAFISLVFGAEDDLRIEPETVRAKLDQPGLNLLDVRIVSDWKKSDLKIPGAVRVDPHDVSSWASKYPKDELLVLYCS